MGLQKSLCSLDFLFFVEVTFVTLKISHPSAITDERLPFRNDGIRDTPQTSSQEVPVTYIHFAFSKDIYFAFVKVTY